MACSVALAQSGMTPVHTLSPRLKIPNTGVFLYAPRPRLPLMITSFMILSIQLRHMPNDFFKIGQRI